MTGEDIACPGAGGKAPTSRAGDEMGERLSIFPAAFISPVKPTGPG